MKTLNDYTKEVVKIFNSYTKTGTVKWDYKIALLDLQYQIGSLTKRVMQLDNQRHKEGLTEKELKEKVADELADIFAETLFIVKELNVDIDKAFQKMIQSDKVKISSRKN
jgi:NTP pyrophosphatase (non-canonical NTP hydrolase)